MIARIGTSDRLCWLAETCKILLLLHLSLVKSLFFSEYKSICMALHNDTASFALKAVNLT